MIQIAKLSKNVDDVDFVAETFAEIQEGAKNNATMVLNADKVIRFTNGKSL